jgi:outer membrane usher protein
MGRLKPKLLVTTARLNQRATSHGAHISCLFTGALLCSACFGTATHAAMLDLSTTGVPDDPNAPIRTAPTYSVTLPVIFEGTYLGDVPVLATSDGKISVNVDRISALLGTRISPELIAALKKATNGQPVLPIDAFNAAGVTVTYDPTKLELHVSVPLDRQGRESVSALQEVTAGQPGPNTVPPENFSGSLTLKAQQSYEWTKNPKIGFGPMRVSADLAVNLFGPKGVYLFAQGNYDASLASPLQRGNVVLIHDDVAHALRYSLGDVSPVAAGFQSTPTLGGFSIEKQYGELQPFNNIRPSGLFKFTLDRASNIDVVVNGATIRTIHLEAGQYDLKDFPFFDGLNEVELYSVDQYGRHLLTTFSQYFSAKLLNKGVWEYGLAAGVPQTIGTTATNIFTPGAPQTSILSTGTAGIHYANLPSVSGYIRYGVTKDITLGLNLQYNRSRSMEGLEAAWGSPIGTFAIVAGESQATGFGSGQSFLVSYDATLPKLGFLLRPQVNVQYTYTSEQFATDLVLAPNNPFRQLALGRFSAQLPHDFGIGFSGSYGQGSGTQANETRYAANVTKRIGFVNMSLSYERVATVGPANETRVLFTATVPLGVNQNVRTTYDSVENQAQVEYTRFDRDELNDVGVHALIGHDNNGVTAQGELDYDANRFSLQVQQNMLTGATASTTQTQETTYTVGTQIAFAGNQFAIGRPVGPDFAIVAAHPTLAENSIGVRQGIGRDKRQAETGFLGPALAPAGTDYRSQLLYVDVDNLPTGYDIGPGQYELFPGPASGYLLIVGSDASRVVLGTLLGADGKPVALQGGELLDLDNPKVSPAPVFTNSAGRFVASGIAPGRYKMVLGADGQFVVFLTVPKQAKGLVDVGTVRVAK